MQNQNASQLPMVRPSALAVMATRYDMDPQTLLNTLKNTVFKGATNEQLAALVVVSNEHGLNPFTREIYAFPDKSGGIQAVIGVDGWIRIITQHPQFDGVQFTQDADSCTCTIFVRGRSHPVIVTEYLEECRRNTDPWTRYPRRMLRHKALIQCGRIAFGLGTLKDEDDVVNYPGSSVIAQPPSLITAPITTTVVVPESQPQEDGDIGPTPPPSPAPTEAPKRRGRPPMPRTPDGEIIRPAAPAPPPVPTPVVPEQPAPQSNDPLSPQDQLREIVLGAGFDLGDFIAWGKESGNLGLDADLLDSWEDVRLPVAKRLLEARGALVDGLKRLAKE